LNPETNTAETGGLAHECLGIRSSDCRPTLLITEFSGLIAVGKFEKLNEAGVIGGSAKQEFLGVHFFPNPKPERQELSHKYLHPVEKGTPFSPTFATPVIVFPLPHNQQASLEWPVSAG